MSGHPGHDASLLGVSPADSDLFSFLLSVDTTMGAVGMGDASRGRVTPSSPLVGANDKLVAPSVSERRSLLPTPSEDFDFDDEDDEDVVPKRRTSRKRKASEGVSAAVQISGSSTMEDDEGGPISKKEKQARRLEKNREIARNCRQRKRDRMARLSEEVERLKAANRALETKLDEGRAEHERESIRRLDMEEIKGMLHSDAPETTIQTKLSRYSDVYADFGKDRKRAIAFHLEQLKALLLPNQVSKMTLWSLHQEDEFYDEKKNADVFGGGIWNMLSRALGLSEEQKKSLINMRHDIRAQRKNVITCLNMLAELNDKITENFESMTDQMQTIMSVISPAQQAKFLLWIEENQPALLVLNDLWQKSIKQRGGEGAGAAAEE